MSKEIVIRKFDDLVGKFTGEYITVFDALMSIKSPYKDMNEKDIFSGDIVEISREVGQTIDRYGSYRGVVHHSLELGFEIYLIFEGRINDIYGSLSEPWKRQIKVLGNRWENGNLITETKK